MHEFQVRHFAFLTFADLYRLGLDMDALPLMFDVSIRMFQSVCMWLCRSGTFLVTHFIFLCFVGIEMLDLDLYIEFKSPVQSGFFAFFGRKPDWTALGSLGMVPGPFKDQSKVVATSFSKNRSKTSQNC